MITLPLTHKWSPPRWLLWLDLYIAEIVCLLLIPYSNRPVLASFLALIFTAPLYPLIADYLNVVRDVDGKLRDTVIVLAQSIHFVWGMDIPVFVFWDHLSLTWIVGLLFAELVFKEGLFDQIVEGESLLRSGLLDWSFYVLGSAVAFTLLEYVH